MPYVKVMRNPDRIRSVAGSKGVITMWESAIGVLGTGLLGVIGWAFTLHGKIAMLTTENKGLKELMEAKFDAMEQRLVRIEAKIDRDGE